MIDIHKITFAQQAKSTYYIHSILLYLLSSSLLIRFHAHLSVAQLRESKSFFFFFFFTQPCSIEIRHKHIVHVCPIRLSAHRIINITSLHSQLLMNECYQGDRHVHGVSVFCVLTYNVYARTNLITGNCG